MWERRKQQKLRERKERERVLNLKSRNLRTLKYHCTEEIKKPAKSLEDTKQAREMRYRIYGYNHGTNFLK